MQRSDFRFLDRLRVRWAEIDMQKIVFNAHYLMYFDTAIAGYWRALALPYAETMEALGGDLYVRKATVEYMGSARFDDVLDIGLRCARIGNSSIVLRRRRVPRRTSCWSPCELVYVFADPATQTRKPVPRRAARAARGFEAGAADGRRARRQLGASSGRRRGRSAARSSSTSRTSPPRWNGTAPTPARCTRSPQPPRPRRSRTGRLLEHVPGVAKIGRMAVAARVAQQRRRPRRARRAARRGARRAATARRCCTRSSPPRRSTSAPASSARGPEFDEAGIAHVEMLRAL